MNNGRLITKISRVAQLYAGRMLEELGMGPAAYECLRQVRKHPGISQNDLSAALEVDKSAVARMTASLERKGYLVRRRDEQDLRRNRLYATDRAMDAKQAAVGGEQAFYDWLLAELPLAERDAFCATLEKLYARAKTERKGGFASLAGGEGK